MSPSGCGSPWADGVSTVTDRGATGWLRLIIPRATSRIMFFKQIGVGLGVAILIDATIIRAILLPASMKLLGDWNWYLPKWLEWLPRVSTDGDRRVEAPRGSADGD